MSTARTSTRWRLPDFLYKITPEEQARLSRQRVGIVGLSVGQSVAVTMALERGFGEVRLADFDGLELSNLNRIRAGVHSLGLPKVIVTAREIAEIDPFLSVRCYPDGVTPENLEAFLFDGGFSLDLLIDECDSLDVKILLRSEAKARGIPVLMDTSDRGLLDVERFDREPERPILHGLVGDLDPRRLRGLTTEEKIPYILQMLDLTALSTRMRASLIEVEQTITTWPQLASAVVHGGAAAADVARRIALGQMTASGRYRVDLEALIPGPEPPRAATDAAAVPPPPPQREEMLSAIRKAEAGRPAEGGAAPLALERDQVGRLVAAAIAAPSGGNCQPWKWLYREGVLSLFHDPARSRSLLDFQGAGAMLSLGAAAENLILAAHHEGLAVELRSLAEGGHPEWVAAFRFYHRPNASRAPREWDDLSAMIGVRHTNRKLAPRRTLRPEDLRAMDEAVRSIPGAELQILEAEQELEEVGRLLGAGDRLRLLDRRLNREMMGEVRWSPEEARATRDGIAIGTMELKPLDRAGLKVCRDWPTLELIREWGVGSGLERMAVRSIASAGAVGLVTLPRARPADYFQGGRAVQRAWLTASRRQIAFQPMTALPYLFARLVRGGGEGLDATTLAELRPLRPPNFRVADLPGRS
jgi:hypothetical protein